MAATLGNVLYWLCSGLAAILAALAALLILAFAGVVNVGPLEAPYFLLSVVYAGGGMGSWLIGRALKRVFAGT